MNTDPARQLPKRDYVLLPVIFIFTIIVLLLGGEVTARMLYPQDDDAEPCEYSTPSGFRYRPMCTSRTKVWEGPWVTQQFNACGYRTPEPCAPRPPGSLRVVVMGSSTSRGALVNYDDSFAGRAEADLSRQCGEAVDFQNLGTEPPDVDRIDARLPEVLSLRPIAIILAFGPYDLLHLKDPPPDPAAVQAQPDHRPNLHDLVFLLRGSRLFLVMQYYLYRDPAFQVRAFLLNGDSADYVRTPLGPFWRQRVADFGDLLGRITAQTGPVPVLSVYIPERAQAALAGPVADPPGVDPLALGTALRAQAASHGAGFVDVTKSFGESAGFQSLYYLTDGHPRSEGHAVVATAIEQSLLAEPAFARCHHS